MRDPDPKAVTLVSTTSSVMYVSEKGEHKWKTKSEKQLPTFMAHGTSVENAMQILRDTTIKKGKGIAGCGVYAFAIQEPTLEEDGIKTLWNRTRTGSYNRGAMFTFKPMGMMVTSMAEHASPPEFPELSMQLFGILDFAQYREMYDKRWIVFRNYGTSLSIGTWETT